MSQHNHVNSQIIPKIEPTNGESSSSSSSHVVNNGMLDVLNIKKEKCGNGYVDGNGVGVVDENINVVNSNGNSNGNTERVSRPVIKDKSSTINVASRYKQAAAQRYKPRSNSKGREPIVKAASKPQMSTSSSSSSLVRTRPSTPSRINNINKTPSSKKSSTPLLKSSDKSLNCSGVSAIVPIGGPEVVNQEKDGIKDIKKYASGALGVNRVMGRRSSLAINYDEHIRRPVSALPMISDNEEKNKQYEKTILEARYLQSALMLQNTKKNYKSSQDNFKAQIMDIWEFNRDMREKLNSLNKTLNSFEVTKQALESVECLEAFMNEYRNVRQELDDLTLALAQEIDKQKLCVDLKSLGLQNDKELTSLLSNVPTLNANNLLSIEHVVNCASQYQNLTSYVNEFESFKANFNRQLIQANLLAEKLKVYKATSKQK